MKGDVMCFCDWIDGWMFRRTERRMPVVLWILADLKVNMGVEMRDGLLFGVNKGKGFTDAEGDALLLTSSVKFEDSEIQEVQRLKSMCLPRLLFCSLLAVLYEAQVQLVRLRYCAVEREGKLE